MISALKDFAALTLDNVQLLLLMRNVKRVSNVVLTTYVAMINSVVLANLTAIVGVLHKFVDPGSVLKSLEPAKMTAIVSALVVAYSTSVFPMNVMKITLKATKVLKARLRLMEIEYIAVW